MWYCDVIVTLPKTIPWRLGFHGIEQKNNEMKVSVKNNLACSAMWSQGDCKNYNMGKGLDVELMKRRLAIKVYITSL